jgi:hypothetical protein
MTDVDYKEEILISEKKLRSKTIISFTVFILLMVAAVFAWKKLHQEPKVAYVPKPLRSVLNYNENFFSNFLTDNHLAKSYPVSDAVKNVRVNGNVGMENDFDPSNWKLQVIRSAGDTCLLYTF